MASPITFSQLQLSLSFQLMGIEEPAWMVPGIAPQQFDNAKSPLLICKTALGTKSWALSPQTNQGAHCLSSQGRPTLSEVSPWSACPYHGIHHRTIGTRLTSN